MAATDQRARWRSVFLSDIHLGTRGCRAAMLAKFLREMRTDQLFLLGDIVDLESMQRDFYWPEAHERIYQEFLDLAGIGTRVVYVPGNHDAGMRRFCGSNMGGVEIRHSLIHETAAGERLLLVHGDEFDVTHNYNPALARLARVLYRSLLRISALLHAGRAWAGRPYWSLLSALKSRVQAVRAAVARFEDGAARAGAEAGVDTIVCGHIHRPTDRQLHGVRYVNTGDWVEHCTALVEHHDGRLELLDWADQSAAVRPRVRRSGRRVPAAA